MSKQEFTSSPLAVKVLHEIQRIFDKEQLSMPEALCVCAELTVWSLLVAIPDQEACHEQLDLMVPPMHTSIDDNYPAIAARREVLAELDRTGGAVQ